MQLSTIEKEQIRDAIKNALLESLNNCTRGHLVTNSPVTSFVGVTVFEDGNIETKIVGSMSEIPLYGALEKAKISIREICINNEVENAVNNIAAQFEAAAIPPGEKN